MVALRELLADDVELPSPLFGAMRFRGRDDVGFLLGVVYRVLGPVTWETPVSSDRSASAVTHTRIGPMRIDDAMIFELDGQGLIRRIRPHLRPLAATALFALMVGPRVLARPGAVLRAVRNGLSRG
jgi:hypothetical protein